MIGRLGRLVALVGWGLTAALTSSLVDAQPASPVGKGKDPRAGPAATHSTPSGNAVALAKGEGRILRFASPVESVFVADTDIADVQVVSPGVVYVHGKSLGTTNLVTLGANDKLLGDVPIRVNGGVAKAIVTHHPEARVTEAIAGNQRIAHGSVADPAAALDLNTLLSAGNADGVASLNAAMYPSTPQINLRVRFAEVSRSELLRYGVNWSALFSSGSFSFGLATGGPLAAGAASSAGNVLGGGFQSGSANIDVLLEALQSNGILEILAEPNITAVTGQTASFLAGGEIPVPVPVNRDLVGIEYKPYGVSLVFTPTLLPNNRISLEVKPEVSTLAANSVVEIAGFSIPTFQVRRADTRVEVGSGQTFAIAGLFQRSSASDIEKLPLLGDIPIIGALFRSQRFQRNETELVILITPYLVEPVSHKTLAMPLDGAMQNPARLGSAGPMGLQGQSAFGFYVE